MAAMFSAFRLKPIDRRVYRRIDVRTVQPCRSTNEVEMCIGSRSPIDDCRNRPNALRRGLAPLGRLGIVVAAELHQHR